MREFHRDCQPPIWQSPFLPNAQATLLCMLWRRDLNCYHPNRRTQKNSDCPIVTYYEIDTGFLDVHFNDFLPQVILLLQVEYVHFLTPFGKLKQALQCI